MTRGCCYRESEYGGRGHKEGQQGVNGDER